MSDHERFQRVAELFEAARGRHDAERDAFLRDACRDDADLLARVARLLDHHDDGSAPLGTLLVARATGPATEGDATPPLPDVINQYRVKRLIGAGGMGAVYLAEQDKPRRDVAVKVIRPGLVGRELLRRFDLEAAMLGRLQHPGIAQIYEAGSCDDGSGARPYFAMEYVDGAPLLEHARARGLGIRDRLELFVRICDAVHHAHQRGVIHRDLKPGNILVDATGQPKILDFGVARATDRDLQVTTIQTDAGQLIGTLPYMSPEQVDGRAHDVDVRSDVYALGVILYELLGDRLPYDLANLTPLSAARVISEEPPAPLSAVDRIYRGDLNTIVLKALEKDPRGRYQSASDLGADVRRFLADEPIVARPATTMYQLRKFARRNRKLVVGAALLLLTIVAGAVISTVSAIRADRAARREHWQAYLANIGGADSALQLHDVATAERRLLAIDHSDRGNWEWRHLTSRLDESAAEFGSEDKPRSCVAYSPDGRLLATGTVRGVALLWDAPSRTLLRSFGEEVMDRGVSSVVFSPDGSRLLTTTTPGPARLWDVSTARELPALERIASNESAVDWGGDLIAIGFPKGEVWLWSAATGKLLRGLTVGEPAEFVRSVRFSPGADRLATIASSLRIWEMETGRLLAESAPSHADIHGIAWNADGTRLATGSIGGLATIWDAGTGRPLLVLRGHEGRISAFDFSPDGARLVTGGADSTLRIWDTATGESLAVLHGHRFGITQADWHPEGGLIATVCAGSDSARLWRADIPDAPPVLDAGAHPYALAFATDGSRLFVGAQDGHVYVLDARSRAPIATLSGHDGVVWRVAVSAEAPLIASGTASGAVRLWDTQTMSSGAVLQTGSKPVTALALSPDATRVAAGTPGPEVKVWDTASKGLVLTLPGHTERVAQIAFSSDGRFIATGTWGGAIRLWNASTGRLLSTISENPSHVTGLVFSADDRLVSAHLDRRLHVWDPHNGRPASPAIVLPSPPVSITFGGTDRLFIGTFAGDIRIMDWPTREEILVLRGLNAPATVLAVSADDVAASDLSRMRLWTVHPLESIRQAREMGRSAP